MGNIFSFFCASIICVKWADCILILLDHLITHPIELHYGVFFSKNRMPSVMLLKIVKQDLQDKESFDGSPSARQFDVQ